MMFHLPQRGEKGFTLLLAALISSIVLSLGAAVFAIAQKQIALASVGKNSQFAFYAADSAAECALFWDVRDAYFAATTSYDGMPTCDGQPLNATVSAGDRTTGNFTMSFSYSPNNYCAEVSVSKTYNPSTEAVTSVIHSDGYSTSCANITLDPSALQRSVELHY
jgi:Tfp pilus assembly protein PilX